MTDKLFSIAGISDNGTVSKARFTNDICRRVKVLAKRGHTRSDFVQLPQPMTKVEAIKYMMTLPEFSSPADQATLAEALATRTPRPKRQRKARQSTVDRKTRTARRQTTSADDILAVL